MPTNRKRVVRSMRKLDLHPLEIAYLFYGEFPKPLLCRMPFTVFARKYGPTPAWRELWEEHRDELIEEWKKQGQKGLLWAERVF
jgi:hypothetical protein